MHLQYEFQVILDFNSQSNHLGGYQQFKSHSQKKKKSNYSSKINSLEVVSCLSANLQLLVPWLISVDDPHSAPFSIIIKLMLEDQGKH